MQPTIWSATDSDTNPAIQEVIILKELDALIDWRLVEALTTVRDFRRVLEVVVFDGNYKRVANVSEERRQQILDQRKWMPKLEELVDGEWVNLTSLYTITSGLHRPQVQVLMFNMTHYVQMFAIAVEQMIL